jgi:predicted neuraminidase
MFYEEEFINEPDEKYQNSHASSIVELPNGDFLAAWFSGTREKNLDVAVVYARKKQGEDHWETPQIFHKTPGRSEGNSCFFVWPDNELWCFWNAMWSGGWTTNKIRYKISKDNGYTWSDPIWFRKPIGWLIRNKPLMMDNGEFLVPTYSEVMSYKSFVMITSDKGKTWKKYGRVGGIKTPCMQPCVVQLKDKSLLMYLRTAGNLGKIYQSRSSDHGRHWTHPIPTQFPNPNAGIDLHRSPEGDLLCTYNDSSSKRDPLNVALSEDEGQTWPYIKTIGKLDESINDGSSPELSYPYMISSSDGHFHIVHTFRRLKIRHVEFDKEWLLS